MKAVKFITYVLLNALLAISSIEIPLSARELNNPELERE
jgi:hypothetical protein